MHYNYHHEYKVRRGDDLSKISKRFRYRNPGPIFYYPENKALFRKKGRSVDTLFPGDQLLVPWRPNTLKRMLKVHKELAREAKRAKTMMIRREEKNFKALDHLVNTVDIIGFFTNCFKSIAKLSIRELDQGIKTMDEALVWFRKYRSNVDQFVLSKVIAPPKKGKLNGSFYFRHLSELAGLSPSYVAELAVAYKVQDPDLWKYGRHSLHQKNVEYIKRGFNGQIRQHHEIIDEYEKQLASAFYNKRI